MSSRFPLLVLLIVMLSFGCSEYSKALKSNDLDLKYDLALELYEKEKCYKSMTLLEELIPLTRGTARSESIYYYYAKSIYCNEDYILAGYYFDNFTKTFPQSQFTEECAFLAALCRVKESPQYSLDQASTNTAIDQLQLFVNQYPNTDKKDTINFLMKEMRSKLELKAFENAKLYHRTRRYKSAVIALENTIREYPDSRYSEEMHFLLLESHYELAINSIPSKKLQRLKDAKESYHTFVDNFEESQNKRQADNILKDIEMALDELRTQ